ncbi:hypothetical protein JCM19239_7584 [Vibrio variabilis]|uniref:Uncharacterized protein n=1 Tax=Vibrio variabilis TaxID=990271 RepID=A0ABQ0J610_9VIBR|nr:hypothetical protein JCM19239_7584 [Vibrio variabilis]
MKTGRIVHPTMNKNDRLSGRFYGFAFKVGYRPVVYLERFFFKGGIQSYLTSLITRPVLGPLW